MKKNKPCCQQFRTLAFSLKNLLLYFLLQDSFSKSSSSATAPTANNSSGVPNLNHAAVAPGGGSGGGGGGGGSSSASNFNKNTGGSDNQLSGYSAYNNYNKAGGGYGNSYQYQQYPNSNSFSSQQQQGSGGSAAAAGGSSSQYKAGAGQYDKYDPQLSNPAAAVLGLANTNTTNALSGKVSATTASMLSTFSQSARGKSFLESWGTTFIPD